MEPPRSRANTHLGQWWILTAAWLIHGVLLLYLFITMVPMGVVSPGQRAAIVLAICCLMAAEVGILILVNGGIELLTSRVSRKWLLDGLKSIGLAAGVGLLAASILKLKTTGVHLKTSGLWFAFANFGQLLQES